jgi:glycerol dehydrogenase
MRNDFSDFARPYLHGELVALGLVLQIAYNAEGDPAEFARELRENSIPASISDLGINKADAEELIFDRLIKSTAMAGTSDEEQNRLRDAIKYIM